MAEIVKMPRLSDTMTEGTVAKWHKQIGDVIKEGDLLAEIETDKATMEFESFQDGVLLYIGVEEGKTAEVDSVLAVLGKKGEDFKQLLSEEKDSVSEEKSQKNEHQSNKIEEHTHKEEFVITKKQILKSGVLKASPLAKKLAKEKGIDVSRVVGSGDGGRVVKKDIDELEFRFQSDKKNAVEKFKDVEISQMRKTIAKRLAESKYTAPHFYLTMSINMDDAIKARMLINKEASIKISFNDMVVKAVAKAIEKNLGVNSSWRESFIRYSEHINIGVAVAVDEGLLVPVIKFANTKSLNQISNEVSSFVEKAKNKKLKPEDWEGSTFTISNLGMYGIDEFTAIINPPDACILAVGSIKQKPYVIDGKIVPSNIMKVTLSCDHRAVDGATGASFLNSLKEYLENPVLIFY